MQLTGEDESRAEELFKHTWVMAYQMRNKLGDSADTILAWLISIANVQARVLALGLPTGSPLSGVRLDGPPHAEQPGHPTQ